MATVRIQLRRGTSSQWEDANPILAAGEIGIETDTNTFKFGDGVTTWNNLEYALSDTVDDYIPLSEKGTALGVATLDASGYVPAAQLPPLAKVTVNAVADQAARLALTVEPGDIAIQSDNGTTYVLQSSPATNNANWKEISATAAISAAVSAHEADTTNVHGIANTADLATKSYADAAEADAISAAAADATTKANAAQAAAEATAATALANAVSSLEDYADQSEADAISAAAADATTKANAAQAAAEATAATALSNHNSDNTNVHGIADTSQLVTLSGVETVSNKTLESPILLGTPTAPTATAGQNNTQIATTQFVTSAIADLVSSAPSALNTLDELAAALGDDANFAGSVTNSLALKAPLANPSFTGTASFENATGITKSMVGLGNVDNTSDANKPLSNAAVDAISTINTNIDTKAPHTSPIFTGTVVLPSTTSIGDVSNVEIGHLNGVSSPIQTQIDSKAPSHNPEFTGLVTGITKTMVGLDSVDNTSDADKPVSDATQSALDLKANIDSPTFTGTVSGITASMVGLGNVNNTSDSNKPISTATQTALNLKADLDSPTFTGTVVLPDGTITSGMIANGTIVAADLATDAVSTIKIQDGAVTTAKIPDGAVTTAKVADSSITNIKMADDSVDTAEIKNLAVTTAKIADGAVTTDKIAAGAVVTADLADGAVTSAKIADGTIVDGDINASAAIAQSKVANLTSDLAAKAPLASPTFTGTVTLPTGTVTSGMIADGTIVDGDINASAAIAQSKIANLTSDLAAKAPLASPTFTGTVTLPTGTVTSGMIADGTIVNADISGTAAIALSKLATDPLARANHTGTQLANTISDFDTQVRTSKVTDLAAPTGSFSMNSQKITNLAAPTDGADAATKAYVDGVTEGLHIHAAVKAATTTNINLSTDVENGDTLDGVTLATGDRILVKNQTTKSQNGIYVVSASGAPSRALDFDTPAEIDSGDFVFVDQGTANGNTGWVQVNVVGTVGTDDVEFTQFSGAGTYLAGTGLTLTGNTFSINTGTTVDLNTAQTLTNKTFVAPVLGAATATSINGTTIPSSRTLVTTADTGTVTSTMIADGTIATGDIADGAITTAKIALGAVVTEDLADGAVTSAKIADGTIVDGDINASAAIAQSKIANLTSDLAARAPLANPTFTGIVTVAASGIAFTDGTQTKEGVPSRTEIVQVTGAYNLSTGGLVLRDEMIEVSHTGGSAVDITVPADSTTNFPIGTSIDLLRTNSGKVRVVGAAGVTVNATPGAFLREQWSGATLFKRAANTWVLMGDLATS